MLRVFIGYDAAETVAFHVAAFSILRRSSVPVSITGLVNAQLPMWRERDERQSTDFAFSRFLVPWLMNYQSRAVFMDCDVLCRADIAGLFDAAWPDAPVSVVHHDYTPLGENKFLDQKQSAYPRKNWSSVMVFNSDRCRALTPQYVNEASGLDLHQFKWVDERSPIGELRQEWNHLVGEYPPNPEAKLVHFTLGTPCFAKYRHCEFAQEWFAERDAMLYHDRTGEYSRPARVEA